MIRIELPSHLRTLARIDGEVTLIVEGPITLNAILDALENRYPALCGTIRDHSTHQRRAFLRYFACEQDVSFEAPDCPLPEAIAKIPFELNPIIHVVWLVGLIPTLSGLGRIIAGLSIRQEPAKQIESPEQSPLRIDLGINQGIPSSATYPDEMTVASPRAPDSVTDRTTNILEHKISRRQTNDFEN